MSLNLRQVEIWAELGTFTNRAMRKTKTRWGHPYTYSPRGDLIKRLQKQFGLTADQVYGDLMAIREEQLRRVRG